MPPGCAGRTGPGGTGSRTRYWSTCAPGWPPRTGPGGSSRSRSQPRRRRVWSGRSGCWTSTPLYDAVSTMDTITLIRSAVRGPLRVPDARLDAEMRAGLSSGDDNASTAKPAIDWDHLAARDALIARGHQMDTPRSRHGLALFRNALPGIAAVENLAATYLGGDVRNVVSFIAILVVLAMGAVSDFELLAQRRHLHRDRGSRGARAQAADRGGRADLPWQRRVHGHRRHHGRRARHPGEPALPAHGRGRWPSRPASLE